MSPGRTTFMIDFIKYLIGRLSLSFGRSLLYGAALLLMASAPGFSQNKPDCSLVFTFTTVTSGSPFDNRGAGCTTWTLTYNNTGFSALSLLVQTAPNNGGAPGSWSTFTPTAGANPNTTTTQNVTQFGGPTSYFPWLRIQLTSKTGTGQISGQLYGWRVPPEASVIVTPSGTQDVNITEVDGVAAVAASAGVLGVGIMGNLSVLTGQQTLTNAAVALATHAVKNICIEASPLNAADIFYGPTGVTTSTGMRLPAGAAYCGPVANTNLIFIVSVAGGETVSWFATQ